MTLPAILLKSYPLKSRRLLQAQLMDSRGYYPEPHRKAWLCAICQQPIWQNQRMDMHEALLTREHVKSNQDIIDPNAFVITKTEEFRYSLRYSDLIFNSANVVLRHHATAKCWHTPGVGGDDTFTRCAQQLLAWGEPVQEFLRAMLPYYPTNALFALRRFEALT